MQTSQVIGLILICDKFEYKVAHTFCYLFGKCFRKTSKKLEIIALSWAVKSYLKNF